MALAEILRTRELIRSGQARVLREAAQLPQAAIAEEIGVDVSTVHRWEAGITEPRGDLLRKYGRVLTRLQVHSDDS
jgi:transcriptional regulator with XRE-family HTH domain